jgi:hypothetical protein
MRLYINQLTAIGRKRAEELQAAAFAWGGRDDYPCTTTGFSRNQDLRDAGFKQMSDGVIILRRELFAEAPRTPQENEICRVQTSPEADWLTVRITSVLASVHGEELHLTCVAA